MFDSWEFFELAERMVGDVDADRMAQIAATVSKIRAYHGGAPQRGEFHDSDFCGAMYADGDEGLRLAPLAIAENRRARPNTVQINRHESQSAHHDFDTRTRWRERARHCQRRSTSHI